MSSLGIDIGSLAVSVVLLEDGEVAAARSREHGGDIAGTVRELTGGLGDCERVGVTGQGAGFIDPFLATIVGAHFLLPAARDVFAVGAQSFALIFYDEDGRYREHSVNPPCAAGTGSFLEQQARRLGLSIEEFARRAGATRASGRSSPPAARYSPRPTSCTPCRKATPWKPCAPVCARASPAT